jgi:hypothetical protein
MSYDRSGKARRWVTGSTGSPPTIAVGGNLLCKRAHVGTLTVQRLRRGLARS